MFLFFSVLSVFTRLKWTLLVAGIDFLYVFRSSEAVYWSSIAALLNSVTTFIRGVLLEHGGSVSVNRCPSTSQLALNGARDSESDKS